MKQGEIGEQTHLCEECGKQFLSDLDVAERGETIKSFREFAPNDEVEMAIEKVIISEKHESQMIVFREADGNRRLQFVLGIFEATCVERILNGESYPRPLTHDSWFASIRALGATVASVRIHDRRESTFFAELTLNRGSETATVDVRPSDGLALTLKARVKFFVLERLLREAT